MPETTLQDANAIADQLVAWRRHLHAHPEISGQEEQTAKYIADELERMGYETERRIGDTHGLTANLRVNDRPALALRADFDALPIQEENEVEYASCNAGAMHACGHDAHTAMLLGAAAILKEKKDQLRRSVRFVFQPCEEAYPGGAAPMIAGGVLNNVDAIFGIHISSQLQPGELGTRAGAIMSAVNDFGITIHGKGGHAAMPEQCADPIVAAAHVIVALQTITSRSISITDSAVVSVTRINAGTADNVLPESVALRGTIRNLDETVRKHVCKRVKEIAETTALALGTRAEVEIEPGYPVVINDAKAVEQAFAAARLVGFDERKLLPIPPIGGGEDFAYYLQKVPGAFVFLGAGNTDKQCHYPHHHPRFNIDEDMLPWGTALHVQYALSRGA